MTEDRNNEHLPIKAAAEGDEEAFGVVLHRMMPLIQTQIRLFSDTGVDGDDLYQECLVALLAAIRRYQPDGGASFTTFATVCMRNRLISAARRHGAVSQREFPLDSEMDVPSSDDIDPVYSLLLQEDTLRLRDSLQQHLTPLEYGVLLARLGELSYHEIAEKLGVSTKAVDNAVQRLRRKLSTIL